MPLLTGGNPAYGRTTKGVTDTVNTKIEDNRLTLYLEGRIDSNNASAVEAEL